MKLPIVKESCKCGAVFEFTGLNARWAVEEFRRNHAICRENRWPWWIPKDSSAYAKHIADSKTPLREDEK